MCTGSRPVLHVKKKETVEMQITLIALQYLPLEKTNIICCPGFIKKLGLLVSYFFLFLLIQFFTILYSTVNAKYKT